MDRYTDLNTVRKNNVYMGGISLTINLQKLTFSSLCLTVSPKKKFIMLTKGALQVLQLYHSTGTFLCTKKYSRLHLLNIVL